MGCGEAGTGTNGGCDECASSVCASQCSPPSFFTALPPPSPLLRLDISQFGWAVAKVVCTQTPVSIAASCEMGLCSTSVFCVVVQVFFFFLLGQRLVLRTQSHHFPFCWRAATDRNKFQQLSILPPQKHNRRENNVFLSILHILCEVHLSSGNLHVRRP